MLFGNVKEYKVQLPRKDTKTQSPATINSLVDYLCENTMKDRRKELFVQDGTV
jgi:ubiquitin related modifier 1